MRSCKNQRVSMLEANMVLAEKELSTKWLQTVNCRPFFVKLLFKAEILPLHSELYGPKVKKIRKSTI